MKRMRNSSALRAGAAVLALGVGSGSAYTAHAAAGDIQIVADDIGGVVTSSKGPEAGVWVIAETHDVGTRFIKEVVTDDQGRFVLPQLPKAKYKVWVRGYGLVDSKPVDAMPGKLVNLTAVLAPDGKAAAQYYPANYWFSLIHPPADSEFPGTGAEGNGIAPVLKTQQEWLGIMKEQCLVCHQLGEQATRELANNTPEGWAARISQQRPADDPSIGIHGSSYAQSMNRNMAHYGRDRGLKMFADWTQRIEKGEYPLEAPPRPAGVERNVVLTLRDWNNGGTYMHDVASSNRTNPTQNANGPIYGIETNLGKLAIMDLKKNTIEEVVIPGADKFYPHSVVLDDKNRVWVADLGQAFSPPSPLPNSPAYCSDTASNKFAKYYPEPGRIRHAYVYDPASKQVTDLTTCFGTHHAIIAADGSDTVYFSGDSNVIGWVDRKVLDATHDVSKAQGWCPMVLDTKERGVTKVALGGGDDVKITPDRTLWNEPGKPADPKKDTRITGYNYGLEASPFDGSVWFGNNSPAVPSGLVRFERGAHPPETCKTEYYQPPKLPDGNYAAFDARGVTIDSKGIAWAVFGSGQVGRFDRSKCKVMNGPTATGQHCPEGWTIYDTPGPRIGGIKKGYANADWSYQGWVDIHNVLGLGDDTPMVPGTNSDSLLALDKATGKFVTMRVPYPMGFYSRWVDGRIDDAKAGWKGRGLWATYSDVPVWHQEGGVEGDGPQLVNFQLRPDPLAH